MTLPLRPILAGLALAVLLAAGAARGQTTQPTTRPVWTVPDFIIAVDQQPISLQEQWKVIGCNTLWGIGQGEDQAAWVREANRLGMYQVRAVVGDPAIDAANPLLLAWLHTDEPDLKGIPASKLKADRAGPDKAATVRSVPWAVNFSGGLLGGLVKPSAVPVAPPDYPALSAQAEWVGQDFYPVSGWNLAPGADLFMPYRLTKQLQRDNPGKPVFVYVEMSKQNLQFLPNGGRCATPSEFRLQLHAARKAGVKGIILFPEMVGGGFAWDNSPADLKMALSDFVENDVAERKR